MDINIKKCYIMKNKKEVIMKIQIGNIIKLILILLWMIAVFVFSSENGEKTSGTSKGFIRNTLSFAIKGINLSEEQKEQTVDMLEPITRKLAHFTLYLLGGILIINFVNGKEISENSKIGVSTLFGFLYACSDEIHQLFVDGRNSSIFDVGIDTLGVLTGVLIFLLVVKIKKCNTKI